MNQCEQTISNTRPFFGGKEGERIVNPFRRTSPRVGRNQPCHCGSGDKFKKCHGKAA